MLGVIPLFSAIISAIQRCSTHSIIWSSEAILLLSYNPCRRTHKYDPLHFFNSQGIPLKLLAVESLLENFPELRGKVIMFMVVRDDGRRGDR